MKPQKVLESEPKVKAKAKAKQAPLYRVPTVPEGWAQEELNEITDYNKWCVRYPKSRGSLGVYVVVITDMENMRMLVHRRNECVGHRDTVAAPGGMISKSDEKRRHNDFDDAARYAARRELWEESGMTIDPDTFAVLPHFGGKMIHWNFAASLEKLPDINGAAQKAQ